MEKEGAGRIVIILIIIAVVIYILVSSGVLAPILEKLPIIDFG